MKPSKQKILVIDDDASMIRLAKKILAGDYYDVYSALDGKSGLKMAREHVPDLILLDVLMTDLDGEEVARHLYDDEITKEIPIVFLTITIPLELDKGKEEIVIDGRTYRAFAKPMHQRKLLSVIRKEINKRNHNNL